MALTPLQNMATLLEQRNKLNDQLAELYQRVDAATAAAAGRYTKPGSGIPSTDLAAGVQTAIARATTAVLAVADRQPDGSGNVALQAGDISGLSAAIDARIALALAVAPSISVQPIGATASVGAAAAFSVTAGGPAPLTYQWQRSVDGGATWSNVSGATGASYTTGALLIGDNGYLYRVLVNNATGSVTSSGAVLTVTAAAVAPAVTTQPSAVSVNAGQTAVFASAFSGAPAPTVQWQRSTDAGATWANISGASAVSYTTAATTTTGGTANNGDRYRCVATNAAGTATTSAAALTVAAVVDTRPRFFVAPANAYNTNTAALVAGGTPLTGGTNGGKSGTFSLTTSAGNFGWVAVLASAVGAGIRVYDGLGYGGWSGAGLVGNNTGSTTDPSTPTQPYTDASGTWALIRQDYINANPSAANYTVS